MQQKRIFIIHGWHGYPGEGWLPWLSMELDARGFKVETPEMPNTEKPKIDVWVSHLTNIVGESNVDTYFVGHSIGCQAILRYFETFEIGQKAGGAVLVAPWFSLFPEAFETEKDKEIARPWLETPIDFERVKKSTDNIIAILSDDDPYVPLNPNKEILQEKLDAQILVEHKKKHFSGEDDVSELPSALNAISEISSPSINEEE